jgi:hypothetical protein
MPCVRFVEQGYNEADSLQGVRFADHMGWHGYSCTTPLQLPGDFYALLHQQATLLTLSCRHSTGRPAVLTLVKPAGQPVVVL